MRLRRRAHVAGEVGHEDVLLDISRIHAAMVDQPRREISPNILRILVGEVAEEVDVFSGRGGEAGGRCGGIDGSLHRIGRRVGRGRSGGGGRPAEQEVEEEQARGDREEDEAGTLHRLGGLPWRTPQGGGGLRIGIFTSESAYNYVVRVSRIEKNKD